MATTKIIGNSIFSNKEKLRRITAASRKSANPLTSSPWIVAADWAQSTAYTAGQVRKANSNLYVCVTAGTSAGSGTGPSSVNGDSQTDGSAMWTCYGLASGSSDSLAPTLSTSTSGTISGYDRIWNVISNPGAFLVEGASAVTYAVSYIRHENFSSNVGTREMLYGKISCNINSEKFAIGFSNTAQRVRVIIDGRYVKLSALTPATTSAFFYEFDFSATTGRKTREITIECEGSTGFYGVRLPSAYDSVWAPVRQERVRAVVISDSIVAGSSYGPFISPVTTRLGHHLGWKDVWMFAKGGTGYINQGVGSAFYTYRQRVAEALTLNPDAWILFGSTNDLGQSAGVVQAEVTATLAAIRAGSSAPIFVFGVWPVNNAGVGALETEVSNAVTAAMTLPLAHDIYFIPLFNASPLPWVTGAWNNAANTFSVNAGLMIAGDNTHPADISTAILSERIASEIAGKLGV